MTHLCIKASRPYPVHIEPGALRHLAEVEEAQVADRFWIITDQTVSALHLETLIKHVTTLFPKTNWMTSTVVPGESSKSLETYADLLHEGIERGVSRRTVILAFGGGMIGDLAGFVAATILRGIPFIQIPTTLLAHDSSVGGKVGLNLSLGKNLVGAFYQPSAVLYDVSFLKTLPDREWRSGFFELLKHGLLAAEPFADQLMDLKLSDMKQLPLESWIAKGISVKQRIVEQDEQEQGIRAFLNYGHTFGHAVEYASERLAHGEAVGIGLVFAKMLEGQVVEANQLAQLLTRLGVELPKRQSFEVYFDYMKRDKKNNQSIRFVLAENGKFNLEEIPVGLLLSAYDMTVRCLKWD
ncbi:3-dehydroquinate synthase [Exiguobacterium oxidotolerans]|uniref:3-dehydroquinate synthase n=1 Tax=Exiguobacterium oxidotolerans TaxID=223958 RepID=UPI000494967D|nr:3-dehydroquinate synthase [Exiguobacterium oxidotolerans]